MNRLPMILMVLSAIPGFSADRPEPYLTGARFTDQQAVPAHPSFSSENRDGDPAAQAAGTGSGSYQPLTGKERWNLYLRNTFSSPGAYFRAAGSSLGEHLNNKPPAWEQGAEGYGKRFASRFGAISLQKTYEAAGAALLGHEVRYIRSTRSGFLPRAGHALAASVVTYDRNGRRTPRIARIGSVIGAQFTRSLWMPPGYRDARTALRGAGMEMGVGGAFNLVREFAPELKRIFGRK